MKQILLKPLMTEKATRLTDKTGNTQYVFEVNVDSNKLEIRKAVEEKYMVQVESVRTIIIAPRQRARYTRTGILRGKTVRRKKAYITLSNAQEIDFFNV